VRALAASLFLSVLLLAGAAAAAPAEVNREALDASVRYLQDAQNPDGGFGKSAGAASTSLSSAWVALALAADGINPQDQRKPGGGDVYSYLSGHFAQAVGESECQPDTCTTTLDRELMVANAAGASPHDFGGIDLVAELLGRQEKGVFSHVPGGQPGVNDTIFAIFALAPVEEQAAQETIALAAAWVESVQQENGGWAWSPTGEDETDMTGAAIQALIAAGKGGGEAVREGLDYLGLAQAPDGGFPDFPGTPESNVASTAWAVQAIWCGGENPEEWRAPSGAEPLGYMRSMQEPDGHIRWRRSQDLNGIWMTAYTGPAFGGHCWPFAAVPRSEPPTEAAQPGEGGGTQDGDGVLAGGGGRGAPLFSRPKPQSRGRTPGGARLTHDHGPAPIDRSDTRRGANTVQPSGSESREPRVAQGEPEEVAASSSGGSATGGGAGAGGAGRSSPPPPADGPGGGGGRGSLELPAAAGGSEGAGSDGTVSGAVIGGTASAGDGVLAFGAPGLHGAGSDEPDGRVAVAIAAIALLLALAGARRELRRQAVTL
jgi:hypothetical protein